MLGEKADLTLSKIIPKISRVPLLPRLLTSNWNLHHGFVCMCVYVCIVLIHTHTHIQVNPLFKNSLYAPSFLQKAWNNTCFTNQMKSEEDLHFYQKKKGENKNSIQHLFLQEPLEREKVSWAATVTLPSSFLELH